MHVHTLKQKTPITRTFERQSLFFFSHSNQVGSCLELIQGIQGPRGPLIFSFSIKLTGMGLRNNERRDGIKYRPARSFVMKGSREMEWSWQKGSGEVFLKHLMNFYFRIILDLQKNCKNIRVPALSYLCR